MLKKVFECLGSIVVTRLTFQMMKGITYESTSQIFFIVFVFYYNISSDAKTLCLESNSRLWRIFLGEKGKQFIFRKQIWESVQWYF